MLSLRIVRANDRGGKSEQRRATHRLIAGRRVPYARWQIVPQKITANCLCAGGKGEKVR